MKGQRDFESEQIKHSEENNLTELSLIVNNIVDIRYDKEDDHYYYSFCAKRVLIATFYGVHVKD